MNQVPGHVASLISTIFESAAGVLRIGGENASVFLVPHSDTEFTVSLEGVRTTVLVSPKSLCMKVRVRLG